MQVAIYTRVSTSDQNLELQIEELKEYTKKRNWDIYKIYQDTISGSTTTRPELDQMMKEANQRKFDILLVWKFDRFARSLQMLVEPLNTFNRFCLLQRKHWYYNTHGQTDISYQLGIC